MGGTFAPQPIIVPINGRYNIDNQANDLTGMGTLGTYYSIAVDLGDITTTNLGNGAGGFVFPFPVRIDRVFMDFRQSDVTMGVTNWGWVLSRLARTRPGNTRATTFVYDERTLGVRSAIDAGWAGTDGDNRQYNNTLNTYLDLDLSGEADSVVPALEVINFAVFANGTGSTNTQYILVNDGFMQLTPLGLV